MFMHRRRWGTRPPPPPGTPAAPGPPPGPSCADTPRARPAARGRLGEGRGCVGGSGLRRQYGGERECGGTERWSGGASGAGGAGEAVRHACILSAARAYTRAQPKRLPSVRGVSGVGPAEQALRGLQAQLAQHQRRERRRGAALVCRARHCRERRGADAVAIAGVAEERTPAACTAAAAAAAATVMLARGTHLSDRRACKRARAAPTGARVSVRARVESLKCGDIIWSSPY
jgi:hypothetical protein